MRNSVHELTNLLKSKVQCIWIKTYEEEQVLNDIKNIVRCSFPKTKINSWSFFSGLQYEPLSKSEKRPDPQVGVSPDKLLDIILKNQVKEPNENFWILKDFHLSIETKSIIRGIRDIKDSSKESTRVYNPIIVFSPIVNIPIELEKLFTIVDYSLPDKEEIKLYIEKYIEQISNDNKFTIPDEEEIKSCIDLAQGLTINEIIGYIKRSLVEYKTISQKIFFQARLDLLRKTGILEYQECNTNLDEMGGNGCFKHWISDIKECFEPEAEAFGVVKPKGFLGVGIPGTSKTMSAQIIASTLNLPLLQFKMSSVMHSHVGQSEKNMENALNIIKACSPCVLLIDEIEKTLSGTGSSNQTDGGTLMRVVGQLLEFLGSDNSKDVFTIMTSNNASALPPELTRSGRIDTIWYFSLPTEQERKDIFKIHFNKSNKEVADSLIAYAADKTKNFTGAEIKEIVKVSIRKAYKRYKEDNDSSITIADVDAAIPEVIPVFESSKEKIGAIEEYYRSRARWANNEPEKVDDNFEIEDSEIIDFQINID